jgi:DNA-binding response OmpR family regulator
MTAERLAQAAVDEVLPLVLVADDDTSVRRLVELTLRLNGFEVVSAKDGEEALARAREHRPMAAVLDVGMPGLDGLEVCRRLRADSGGDWRPAILMLTGRSQAEDRLVAYESGADDYIVKPVKLTDLVERVKSRISRADPKAPPGSLEALLSLGELERILSRRMEAGEPVAVLSVGLSPMRGFRQRYGFPRGDRVLEWVATLLTALSQQRPGTLIGRLGADDFLVLTTPSRASDIAQELLSAFDGGIARFYDKADAERGWIEVTDRRGGLHRQRLLKLAVGVATNRFGAITHPRELVETAAEVARYAGNQPGSMLAADRRMA